MQTRNWEDDQGQKHYITKVIAEEAYFAEGKRNSNTSSDPFAASSGETVNGNDFDISSDDDLPF